MISDSGFSTASESPARWARLGPWVMGLLVGPALGAAGYTGLFLLLGALNTSNSVAGMGAFLLSMTLGPALTFYTSRRLDQSTLWPVVASVVVTAAVFAALVVVIAMTLVDWELR